MNRKQFALLTAAWIALLLAGCLPLQAPGSAPAAPEVAAPESAVQPSSLPAIYDYNLGDAILVQQHMPEESRFRNMPVRLNGVIALPEGDGPAPVVLILHGTHAGCPETRHMVDEWPCAPEEEQRNYAGWGWLAQDLAAAGYVALAPNINAEYTFGFGEPPAGVRVAELVDLHLSALAAASAGAAGAPDFGPDLAGRADLSRLLLAGHSRGAGEAWRLIRTNALDSGQRQEGSTWGPALGLLAITPAPTIVDEEQLAIPMALVLAACDGDMVAQDGQVLFENLRNAPGQDQAAVSYWLEGANHNHFNTILGGDLISHADRPGCATLLDGDAQRRWLGSLAVDFFGSLTGNGTGAAARLGLDLAGEVPATLYGQAARTMLLPPAASRLLFFGPFVETDLSTTLQGASILADGVALHFCRAGFFTPQMVPGSEPCRRQALMLPGNPSMAVLQWEAQGAALRFAMPEGSYDLTGYSALSLRVALDPLSPLNAPGEPQAFTVRLTDGEGATATLATPAGAPELAFPAGAVLDTEWLDERSFSAPAPLTTLRLPLASFSGVNLADIAEVALLFDQTATGTLFLADVEVVRPFIE